MTLKKFRETIMTRCLMLISIQLEQVLPTYSFNEIQCNKTVYDSISSLCNDFTSKTFYKVISTYLCTNNITISFDEMVKQFSYNQLQVPEKGSNEYCKAQDLIDQFEHVLVFCTGMDRIPPYGLNQKIEVEFKDVSLPCANTCGLHLTLATVDIKGKLVIAVNFGGGFGKI